ncbi:hypothetical protein V1520DRAFT_372643 [Lipomyces starkeyi]
MLNFPMVPRSSAPSPSRPCSKSATYIDFVNLLLWVLFTNLAFSLGPSILQASDAAAYNKELILALGVALILVSKPFEAATMADLLARSPSLSGRTRSLFGPMFISDFTLFARFTFMLWSVTVGVGLAFGLGPSEFNNKKDDRDIKKH